MSDFIDPVILTAAVLIAGVFLWTLVVRRSDLPAPEPVSPARHLEERKAVIYENLRDLQFEYRLGKLSDHDYQQTKQDLQRELAGVLAEIDRLAGPPPAPPPPRPVAKPVSDGRRSVTETVCPHCGAKFPRPMRFCGECGKPMEVA